MGTRWARSRTPQPPRSRTPQPPRYAQCFHLS